MAKALMASHAVSLFTFQSRSTGSSTRPGASFRPPPGLRCAPRMPVTTERPEEAGTETDKKMHDSCSADDDPSGIGTYVIAGAFLGYTALWTAVFTVPMMI